MKNRVLLLLAVSLLVACGAFAQNTDIEALAGIQFNFANPGARSLGMGGAFLGLADDASAAEANPAGLTILRKPEISLEGRNFRVSQDVNVTGTFPALTSQEFPHFSRRADISFGSISVPFKTFAVAGYYHKPLSYQNGATVLPILSSTGSVVQQVPNFYLPRGGTPVTLQECIDIIRANPTDSGACLEYRILPFVTAVDVNLTTYGVAGAWKYKQLSLGVGARYQKFNEGAFTFRRDFQGRPSSVAVQATGSLENGVLKIKDEHDITWTAGLKWSLRDNLSLGAVYKKGPSFAAPTFGQNAGSTFQLIANTEFHAPDIAGLGISIRPLPVLTINVDADRVMYSNLTDNLVSINSTIRALDHPYETKDVTEYHVGGEYFFATKIPVAIRAGWWRDPAHTMKYQGPLNDPFLVSAAILFPGAETQTHKSIGIGLAWPTFQIDAAYETSNSYKVGSLSAVYRF